MRHAENNSQKDSEAVRVQGLPWIGPWNGEKTGNGVS